MSPPAENARSPEPVITKQPISSSAFIVITASCNSVFSFRFMAFKTSGRFKVMIATPSSFSNKICS